VLDGVHYERVAGGFDAAGGMEGGSGLGGAFSMKNEEPMTLRQGGGRDALVFHRTVPAEGAEVLIGVPPSSWQMWAIPLESVPGMAEISTQWMARAAWVPVMLPPPVRMMCVVICSEPNHKLKRGCSAVTLSLKRKLANDRRRRNLCRRLR
jgi:hypothetical protein